MTSPRRSHSLALVRIVSIEGMASKDTYRINHWTELPGRLNRLKVLTAIAVAALAPDGLDTHSGLTPMERSMNAQPIVALAMLSNLDASGIQPSFTQEHHNGSRFVEMAMIGASGRFVY